MIVSNDFILPKDFRSILVVQLGDIGDVVWSTPTFHSVKEAYPQAKVSVLLRSGMGSILEADPHLHRAFEISRGQGGFMRREMGQLNLIRELRGEKIDCVFDLRSDDRGAFMGYITGARVRASLYFPQASLWRNRIFTHLINEPVPPKDRIHGAAEQSLRIVRAFGVPTTSSMPRLWVSEGTREKIAGMISEEGITDNARWITVNPFSRWAYKEWGYDKWIAVIDWLWDKLKTATVIVGAAGEWEKAEYLIRSSHGRVYNMAGRTTLAELAAVLSMSRLHLGVDSAAPHIAAAVGAPTLTIYGPTDWRDWAPVGDRHTVIASRRECAPCYKKGCEGTGQSKCLDELPIGPVTDVLREVLMK
jgi:predicted lipopolysaccharide heptosyltransferase III